MSFSYEGMHFNACPPIASISINKCNVAFTDQQTRQRLRFENNLQTKMFVNWLLSLANPQK